MSETDNETLNQAVDPPENQGGGNNAAAMNLDSSSGAEQQAVDPPDNNGGTGK